MTITEARATSAFVDRNLYSLTIMGDYMVGLGGNLPAGGSLWGGRAPMVEGYPYTGGVLGGCPGGAVLVSRKKGGKKSVPKLSRLGELLNTQKNVHFFAPPRDARGAPPGGSKKVPFWDPPKYPPNNTKTIEYGPQKGSKMGPKMGPKLGPPGAPRGAPPGRPARPGPGPPGKFPAEISPGRGGPRGALFGGSRGPPKMGGLGG